MKRLAEGADSHVRANQVQGTSELRAAPQGGGPTLISLDRLVEIPTLSPLL